MPGVCLAQIPIQRANHRARRRERGLEPAQQPVEVDRRHESGRRTLGVTLHAGELTREQRARVIAQRQVRREARGTVDVRVAMNTAVAQKLRLREPGNQAEHTLLFRNAKPRLESHEVPHASRGVLAAKLHDRPRPPPRARILESHRLHWAKAQRFATTPRHLFRRHAALEVRYGIELMRSELVGGGQCVDERVILLARHWAVEIRASLLRALHRLLAVARRAKHHRFVERFGRDNRRDGIVECERRHPKPRTNHSRERIARERARGDDAGRRNRRRLATLHRDVRMAGHATVHAFRKEIAIDRECAPCRHSRFVRRDQHHRIQQAHLRLEQPVRVGDLGALERVGADEFGEAIRLVRCRAPHRPHLANHHAMATLCELPGGFGTGQPAAYDLDRIARGVHPA